MAIIPAGSSLRCPNPKCQQNIALVSDDIDTETINLEGLLEPDDGASKEDIAAVKQFCCTSCGEKFIRLNGKISLHTNYGWS